MTHPLIHTCCLFQMLCPQGPCVQHHCRAAMMLHRCGKNPVFPFCIMASKSKWVQRESQRQPLPLRRSVSKNKTTPLAEPANYSVWPLLKYLMIFTSRQKMPQSNWAPSLDFYWGDGSIFHNFSSWGETSCYCVWFWASEGKKGSVLDLDVWVNAELYECLLWGLVKSWPAGVIT